MSVLPMLCWLALVAPGVAVVRRCAPAALGGGAAAALGVGWLAAFAVLAPCLVLAYLLHAPTPLVAILVTLVVVWGVFDALRHASWKGVVRSVPPVMLLAAAVVVLDAVLAERVGAILDNDARVHVARIRFILDHGFSNSDPFVRATGEFPYPLYHTNLLHALHACIAWITGLDPLEVWFGSLGASRLMIAGAAAWTAWSLVGGRWAPWVAAVLAVLSRSVVDFTLYPNQLAPWFAVLMTVGVVAMVLAWDVPARRAIVVCMLANLVVAMMHPLYAGFVLVMLVPVLGAVAAVRSLRCVGKRSTPVACAVGLVLAAAPMLLAVKAMTAGPGRAADVASPSAWEWNHWKTQATASPAPSAGAGTPDALGRARRTAIHRQDGFTLTRQDDHLFIARNWGRGFTGGWGGVVGWRLWTAMAATLLALAVLGRPQTLVAFGAIVVVLTVMTVPILCTTAIGFLGAQWMILRFEALAAIVWGALALPGMAAVCERCIGSRRFVAVPVGLGVTAVSIWVGAANAGQDTWDRVDRWWDRAMASEGARQGAAFDGLMANRAWMEGCMPKDAVVACGRLTGTWAAMLRGPRLVCSERSSTGVPSATTRVLHVTEMLDDRTDEERRAELFRHYGVTHALLGGSAPGWTDYWADDITSGQGHRLIRLRSEPDPMKLWERKVADASRLVLKGCADLAEVELLDLVDERPQAWRGWFVLGNAKWELGQIEAAESCYEMARRQDPTEPMPDLMLGNCAERLGRSDEASMYFESAEARALKRSDRTTAASANFNRANGLRRQGRLVEAESAYRQAVVLDPSHPGARRELEQASLWMVPVPLMDDAGADALDGGGAKP